MYPQACELFIRMWPGAIRMGLDIDAAKRQVDSVKWNYPMLVCTSGKASPSGTTYIKMYALKLRE